MSNSLSDSALWVVLVLKLTYHNMKGNTNAVLSLLAANSKRKVQSIIYCDLCCLYHKNTDVSLEDRGCP